MSGIVRGRYSHPVAIFGISLLEIAAGGCGSFLNMIAFVYVIIYFKTEFTGSDRHKLP